MTAIRALRPPHLDRLGTSHAVVEASAGTGKTYLLEHLVVDLLLRHDVDLEQILVVTFTEKATAELVQRVRTKLTELRDLGPEHPLARNAAGAPDEACWIIDERARQKLRRALLSFDRASITTIHGFCQRLLNEQAFLSHRLFDEELVDEEAAFHTAFLDVIRREVAPDPEVAPYLQAWLQMYGLDRLEQILRTVHRQAGQNGPLRPAPLDRAAFEAALLGCPPVRPDDPSLLPMLKAAGLKGSRPKTVVDRLVDLWEVVEAWRRVPAVPGVLLQLDGFDRTWKADPPGLAYVAQHVAGVGALEPYVTLVNTAVPLSVELVHRVLPRVARRLEANKREAGRLDFQDMLDLVARSLEGDGPRQRALLATLRGRFRHALIDEFQDTDEVQWSIFRRIFVDEGAGVLTVIGDPKQAIYGFRAADVQTYLRACTQLAAEPLYLTDNHRSTARLIDAYNAILDQTASPPFFRPEGKIVYDHPVACGRPDLHLLDQRGHEVSPVMVLDVRSTDPKLLTWQVKQALQARMVDELRALLSPAEALRLRAGESDRSVRPRDVFVLTRTTAESREVGNALRAAQIRFAYFKQEKLFDTVEAREVLDLLRAIAEPDDRTARARAWITAFFGLSLPELAACEDLPPGHPLLRLLYEWRGLAESGDLETMLARIVEDSGLVCREVFLRESERPLTNYLHVLEILQEEVARSRATIRELVQALGGYISETRKPPGLTSDVQRLETEGQAVQIMTIHQAKGLEADVVFVYGGFWDPPRGDVRSFHDDEGRRVVRIGRAPAAEDQLAAGERNDEERRVLYVAITRARGRLYLPRYPAAFSGKLRGCYKFLNERLHNLLDGFASAETRDLFQVSPIPAPVPAPLLPVPPSALEDWQPPEALLVPDPPTDELERLARTRAGFTVTSYSAVKRRQGGFTPVEAAADDPAANEPGAEAAATVAAGLPPDELPRGRLSGSFLHDVLEHVPLEKMKAPPPFEAWRADPEVAALFERMRVRHDRRPAHLPHAQRLVYTALTAPVRLGDTVISGLGSAAQVAREMEFLYPIPEADQPLLGAAAGDGRWHIERGVVKGFVDLLFAHQGRAYVCDWKGDWLPSWEPAALAEHSRKNYGVQARLYTLAALRLLGIDSEAAHGQRFGGVLYCFLRGMRADDAGAGVHFHRPSWQEVLGWEREMLGDGFWRLG